MTAMVALVRGINVGGRAKLAMADLGAVVEGCGHTSASTYIQSGNVVFRSRIADPREVATGLAPAIAAAGDVAPAVMVRTAAEWSAMVADNPFVARAEDLAHLHLLVLDDEPAGPLDSIDATAFLPEELAAGDRHVYLLVPGGIGRSKLAHEVGRRTGNRGTAATGGRSPGWPGFSTSSADSPCEAAQAALAYALWYRSP